jgi:hypothetical protein
MSASSRHDIYSVKELKRSRELSMIGAIVPAVGLREPSGDERYFSLCKIARKVERSSRCPARHSYGGDGLGAFEGFIEICIISSGFRQMSQSRDAGMPKDVDGKYLRCRECK